MNYIQWSTTEKKQAIFFFIAQLNFLQFEILRKEFNWIYFVNLASSSRAMAAINAGMAEWTQQTCIKFKKRTNEAAYVSFFKGSG